MYGVVNSMYEYNQDVIFIEEMTEFEKSGLDADALGYMRGAERRRVLLAAGLNPDEYDF